MQQTDDLVVAWIQEGTLPLTTVDPLAPLDDLAPFAQIVGDTTLVGLGEASHGAHEFFQVKHRLLRFLVEQMGFTLVAVEMDWMAAELINDYILTGSGQARTLLKRNGYWFYHTQEMLDVIEWLHTYNADSHHLQKVHFAGFDVARLEQAGLERVVQYVQRVDPPRSREVAEWYQPMAGVSIRRLPAPPVRQQLMEAASQVSTLLAEQASAYIARSSPSTFAAIMQEARIVEQVTSRLQDADAPRHSAVFRDMAQQREHSMAENIIWLHEQAEGGAKMVLWAHNWHIGTWPVWHLGPDKGQPFPWMGMELRHRYHEEYMTLGSSFVEGAHNALAIDQEGRLLTHPRPPFRLAPAWEGSYEDTFAKAGRQYLLDLRAAPAGAVRDWLAGPHPFRVLNDVHSSEESDYHQAPLLQWFDALLQIEQISPSRLL